MRTQWCLVRWFPDHVVRLRAQAESLCCVLGQDTQHTQCLSTQESTRTVLWNLTKWCGGLVSNQEMRRKTVSRFRSLKGRKGPVTFEQTLSKILWILSFFRFGSLLRIFLCFSVIILAMEQRLVREAMYYASKLGMNNGDYAFISFVLDPVLVQRYAAKPSLLFDGVYASTLTDSLSEQEKKEFYDAYKSMLLMVFNTLKIEEYENFTIEMKHRISEPPFCSDVYKGYELLGGTVKYPNFNRPV